MMTSEARKRSKMMTDDERKRAYDESVGEGRVVNDPILSGITGPYPYSIQPKGSYGDGEGPASEEVRVTATSGGQKGSKPARFDLIPTDALELLARHYGRGAEKYESVNGLDNWRNGYPWSLSYAAMQRHLNQYWSGEDYDEETGSLHLVAAMWHCATLIHFMNHPDMDEGYDDRQDVLDGSRVR